MNLETIRRALQGKKTLFAVAIGLLYLVGVWAGFWEFDEKFLAALGLSAVGFLRLAMKPGGTPPTVPLAVSLGILSVALCGCSLVGKNAAPPTAIEQKLFTTTTNLVPRVETVTNVVTIVQTNLQVQTVTLTNSVGIIIPTYLTNITTETFFSTNTVTLTNMVPVPQLEAGAGSKAVSGIGGAVAAPFGWGGVVSTALAGLFAGYLGLRNRALRGQATVATQAAGALTQNIETLLAVLEKTPQGQAAMPGIKNYLMAHQAEAGVIEQVTALMADFVNTPEAKQSADTILQAIDKLSGKSA